MGSVHDRDGRRVLEVSPRKRLAPSLNALASSALPVAVPERQAPALRAAFLHSWTGRRADVRVGRGDTGDCVISPSLGNTVYGTGCLISVRSHRGRKVTVSGNLCVLLVI